MVEHSIRNRVVTSSILVIGLEKAFIYMNFSLQLGPERELNKRGIPYQNQLNQATTHAMPLL